MSAAVAAAAVLYVRRARRAPTRARLVVGNVLVGAAFVAALAWGAETYLRYVFDSTTWHAGTLVNRAWFRRHERLNSWGWRDREFTEARPPGAFRVVFVGDSFTWGYGVADPADRFGDRVRAELEGRAPGAADVWVVGRIGASTSHEIEMCGQLVGECDVDHVILAYCLNDADDLLPESLRDGNLLPPPSRASLLSHSFLLDLLRAQFQLLRSGEGERYFDLLDRLHRDDASWAVQKARFVELQRVVTGGGARLDVVVFPLFSHWGDDYPFDAWHERVARAWADLGVEVLDLRAAYAGHDGADLRVGMLDAHPNERAHAVAAEAILARWFSK